MKLPRYPKYKDSGVEWLGKVPEHWRCKPTENGQPSERGDDQLREH